MQENPYFFFKKKKFFFINWKGTDLLCWKLLDLIKESSKIENFLPFELDSFYFKFLFSKKKKKRVSIKKCFYY